MGDLGTGFQSLPAFLSASRQESESTLTLTGAFIIVLYPFGRYRYRSCSRVQEKLNVLGARTTFSRLRSPEDEELTRSRETKQSFLPLTAPAVDNLCTSGSYLAIARSGILSKGQHHPTAGK